MLYKDLVFFDKKGVGYNFEYDSINNIWTGSIFLEPVSKGLFETEKIYVTQKYCVLEEGTEVDTNNNILNPVRTYEYGYPGTDSTSGIDFYEFRWDDEIREVDEINMFGFDKNFCPPKDTSALTYNEYNCPSLTLMDNVDITNLLIEPMNQGGILSQDTDTGIYTKTYSKKSNWKPDYVEVNICFCNKNDEYETFRRDLHLYYIDNDKETLIGVFCVYAKSIEEDERLTAMCHNLGYNINNVDFSIFQDSDIKEQLIDNKLMNLKRKEVLMEGHNIYPYIGSYKSIINAIRFFGYDNITIKEWWKNVDITSVNYGKHFMANSYSLKDHEVIHDGSLITLPSKKFRKTGNLTLAYDINKIKKNYDGCIVDAQSSYYGHAYPETEEQFVYTIEEAVIKLWGLKRKLEKEFLPLSSRIIDIVGEASAFCVNVARTVPSQNISFDVTAKVKNDFSILGSEDGCFYIEDLRPFGIHPNILPAGNGMVGNVRNINANYISDGGYQSAYDSISVNEGSDFNEFGNNVIQGYNIHWSTYNSANNPLTGSEIEGYAQDWDLDEIQNFKVSGNLTEIESISGMGNCNREYAGHNGVVPPYSMKGNPLFGLSGHTINNCKPWIYYVLANNSNYGNYYLAEFSDYYPNLTEVYRSCNDFESDENIHLPDNENIPIGALVELKIDEIDIPWNSMVYTWDYAKVIPWNYLNLFANNISRVEWHLHKDVDQNPEYDASICGTIAHGYSDIGIVLPYVGEYDVEMRLYDWNNNMSIVSKPKSITVFPREVEFTGWCKMKTNLITWNDEYTWESLSTEWDFAYINGLTWNDVKSVSFNGLDRGFFAGQYADSIDKDEQMMIYNFDDITQDTFALLENNRGSYIWNNLDIAWQDMDHLWWNALNIGGDIPCYFDFGYFDNSANPVDSPNGVNDSLPGKWLEVVDENNNYGSFRFPAQSSSSLNYIADVARQLNESTDPLISKFYYSYVWDYNGGSHPELNTPEGFHITAVSKNHGRNGDIKYVNIVSTQYHGYIDNNNILHVMNDPDNEQLRFFTQTVDYNPNWNDLVCINNITKIPAYTDVNFNYTNCRILGKKNPVWKFTNLNTGTVYVSTKKNYHRMFKEKGCWEVQLTLNDTNNNVYTAKRNVLMIV